MKYSTYLLAGVLSLSTVLAACEAATTSVPRGRRGMTNTPGETGSTDQPVGETVTADDVKARCEASNLSPPSLRRLTRSEYYNTLKATFPAALSAWSETKLGPDPLSPLKFTNDANVLLIGTQTAKEIFKTAKEVAELVVSSPSLGTLLPCSQAGDQACASSFVASFVPQLYRRPISNEESAELVDYYSSVAERSDFKTGLKWMLVSILQSPQVLYRSELGNDQGELDQFEIATQLAYTYGGTAPSKELIQKAADGKLDAADAIVNEARALQQTPLGMETLRQFFREWSGYQRVLGLKKESEPNFSNIANSMEKETRAFLEEVVFKSNGNVKDLLTANYTFVNSELANFYKFGSAPGTELVKVERPGNWGTGILSQGSFLAATSHPSHTSPIFRGLMVFSRLLCYTSPPPENVPTIDMAGAKNPKTTRELYESAHLQPACSSCHKGFDAFGYAMEHFDERGIYRDTENGEPINTVATAEMADGKKYQFSSFEDMVKQLSTDDTVTSCVSGLLAAYAFGGGGGQICLAEQERAALAAGKYGLREYFIQLANAPSFTRRKR